MKRSARTALLALSLSVLAVPAFADNAQVYYPGNGPASDTAATATHGKTRAQVNAELVAAQKDGSLRTLDQTVYAGR